MKLKEIKIENFRSFSDQTISINDFNVFVGANGVGKSNVLSALNVFFRNSKDVSADVVSLNSEDFHFKNIKKPIKITLTFVDLTTEAQEDFKDYYRNGKLIVAAKAEWDEKEQKADVKQYGIREVMDDFAPFFKALEKEKVAVLKDIYEKTRNKYTELPKPGTKDEMINNLRSYEETHKELCSPKDSEDQFYGWSKGANRLKKYLQWIYVPAVKDAGSERDEDKNSALGQLLERTIRGKISFEEDISKLKKIAEDEYKKIIDKKEFDLGGISARLQERVQQYSHKGIKVKLDWYYDEKNLNITPPKARTYIGEYDFLGEIYRFGHGIQRSFIISILQEMATIETGIQPHLILGIEEPELYQHPPQARYLASVLRKLSSAQNQIVLTTHSPYFVSGDNFEDIRMFRKDDFKRTEVTEYDFIKLSDAIYKLKGEKPIEASQMMAKINQIMLMNKNEMFFSQFVIFVEGIEDIAYLSSILVLSGKIDNFRTKGCHFVPTYGKDSLISLAAIAKGFKIPFFVMFDGDNHKCLETPDDDDETKMEKKKQREHIRKTNKLILDLCSEKYKEDDLKKTILGENIMMWSSCVGDEIKNSIKKTTFSECEKKAKERCGLEVNIGAKNCILIAATIEELFNEKVELGVLENLCDQIIKKADNYC